MKENITLDELKKDFEFRSKKASDKEAFRKRELACYEYIFSNEDDTSSYNQGASIRIIPGFREKFYEYSNDFDDLDISKIRKAYTYFILYKDYNITDPLIFYYDIFRGSNIPLDELEAKAILFGETVKVYYDYFLWLKILLGTKIKYPDKYYAWFHGILIALGKEQNFPSNFSKKEIIEFGKKRYNTGEGFYKVISNLNLTKSYPFLNSMSVRDKGKWKNALIDISNNDIDIISYLKKFPN